MYLRYTNEEVRRSQSNFEFIDCLVEDFKLLGKEYGFLGYEDCIQNFQSCEKNVQVFSNRARNSNDSHPKNHLSERLPENNCRSIR